ncbi:MAG: hypothetical protein O7G85_13770 [Planctomycetota bacterium]|nr:hypothetical protein [Planctomycetota bacterium]
MRWLVDLLYLLIALVTAPVWLFRMVRTGKIHTDWLARFGKTTSLPSASNQRVFFHAVSVGEVNAIRLLVEQLAQDETLELVIATTTDTGFARATSLYGSHHHVVRYPFDFSWAVSRFLRAVKPDLVVLVELEVWPNFTAHCQRSSIPVCIVNGRLTARSQRRYRWLRAVVRPSFTRLAFAAVQNQSFADRFIDLGMNAACVQVTDTMKWDTAQITDDVEGAELLAEAFGIDRSRPLVVAGSTAPDEHELLDVSTPEHVQLLCAPRKPEWFDEAAKNLKECVRRSREEKNSPTGRYLLDTIGELRMAYALADVVVIGRSFGQLHGSDMMEPIALGKPTVIGPAYDDFQLTMDALIEGGGVVQTTREELGDVLRELLDDDQRRLELASKGRDVIRAHHGATNRHASMIRELLSECGTS